MKRVVDLFVSVTRVPLVLWRKVLVTSSLRLYSAATQVLVVAITAHTLGPEGRGEIAAAWNWVSLFGVFLAICLGQAAVRTASRTPKQDWVGPAIAALALATIFMSTVGWALAAAIWHFTEGAIFGLPTGTLLVAFAALPIVIWGQYHPYLLTAAGRLDLANKANFFGRSIAPVVTFFTVVLWGWGVKGAILAMAIGEIAIALGGMVSLVSTFRGAISIVPKAIRSLVKDGLTLVPSTIGWFLATSAQILVVHSVLGDRETGIFQVAAFAIDAIALVGAASALVIYERVATSGAVSSWLDMKRLIIAILVITALLAVPSALVSFWLFPVVFGESFGIAATYFVALLPTLLGRLLSALMTPQWIARGYLWQLSAAYLTIGGGSLLICYTLVISIGAGGALIASNISMALIALCHVGMMASIEKRQVPPAL